MMNLQYRDIALLTTELPDLKHYPELKDHQLNGVQRWVGYNGGVQQTTYSQPTPSPPAERPEPS